jgi:hypothetical protein
MAGIGQELLDVPFAQMVTSLGLAIARAQFELDQVGVQLARVMAGEEYQVDEEDPDHPGTTRSVTKRAIVSFGGQSVSMLELGFTPSFYHFVETIVEVKVSISMSREQSSSLSTFSGRMDSYFALFAAGASVSSVSASFASKYNYSAEGSSLLRTKIVPVPPPAILEQRIKKLLESRTPS